MNIPFVERKIISDNKASSFRPFYLGLPIDAFLMKDSSGDVSGTYIPPKISTPTITEPKRK